MEEILVQSIQSEMVATAEKSAEAKINYSYRKTFLLAILAGIYIGLGGIFATLVSAGATGVMPFGIIKLLMGLVFSLGLILVIVGGAELFTGSTILSIGVLNKKFSFWDLTRNWIIVYVGNLIGALLLALLVFWGKQYTFGNGAMGVAAMYMANSKVHLEFFQAVVLGVLCNVLVCLAIWLTFSAKSTSDKILAIIFPITAFVALGFEHSVASMYILPTGLLIKYFDPSFISAHGISAGELTVASALIKNLIPVTIGNIIGGVAVWVAYCKAYSKKC